MKNIFLLICLLCIGLTACQSDYAPKPRTYYRIELPQKQYQTFDSTGYPFAFEYPVYAGIVPYEKADNPYWLNIAFPDFNGKIHLSYLPIHHNLSEYIADANNFVGIHQQKATGIREKEYCYPEAKVYGMVFEIKGSGVASTYQFYVTDSSKHFVRGALYFETAPNNDSLAPVIDFVKQDIDHLIGSFQWKK